MPLQIQVRRLPEAADLPLPEAATPGAAGLDLCAAVEKELELQPGQAALVPTGLVMAIPQGYEGQVRPRSGLALRHGVTLLNTPGTVDSDYRGEVRVIMINLGDKPYVVRRGDRVAQLVIARVEQPQLVEVEQLPETSRGEGGFGHTGR